MWWKPQDRWRIKVVYVSLFFGSLIPLDWSWCFRHSLSQKFQNKLCYARHIPLSCRSMPQKQHFHVARIGVWTLLALLHPLLSIIQCQPSLNDRRSVSTKSPYPRIIYIAIIRTRFTERHLIRKTYPPRVNSNASAWPYLRRFIGIPVTASKRNRVLSDVIPLISAIEKVYTQIWQEVYIKLLIIL